MLGVVPSGHDVAVAIGDTDLDGKNELVVVDSSANLVRIGRVNSDGSWTQIRDVSLPPHPGPSGWAYWSPRVADMNNDGRPDIVFYERANNQKGKLLLLTNTAAGYVLSAYPTPEVDAAYGMAIADVNGDGLLDAVTANFGWTATANATVLFNALDSSRFTQFVTVPSPSSMLQHLYAADVDRDGWTDILITTHSFGSGGCVLFKNAGGQLAGGTVITGPRATFSLAVGDINQDGRPDLITGDGIPWGVANTANIYRGSVQGFGSPQTLTPGSEPRGPAILDINRDGFTDVIFDNADSRNLTLYLGDPVTHDISSVGETYSSPQLSSISHNFGGGKDPVVAGDVDNDGYPDILIADTDILLIRVNARALDTTPPVVTGITAEPSVVPVTASRFLVTASASDVGSGVAAVTLTVDGTVLGSMQAGQPGTWTMYVGPLPKGVYNVCAQASDFASNISAPNCILVPVYDSTGGFITGGGWILSPPTAYAATPSLSGKATFGFSAKYEKGATIPSGETVFRFDLGDFAFKSSSYQWLVVAGARAQFKGVGTVNGSGAFDFLLTAVDGALAGGNRSDSVRLKVWNRWNGGIVYDNQPGSSDSSEASTALSGGSIVIHQ